MRTLKSKNVNDNIRGTKFRELEKQYLNATARYGVEKVKHVSLEKEMGFKCGAMLGYNSKNEIIFGNAYSEYCGDEMLVMVVVHKSDYLIQMALRKVQK